MSLVATLIVTRGEPGKYCIKQRYEVRFEPGESLLDGLCRIRDGQDATLAFRYSCVNANACKECMLRLDNKTVYACTARLEPREMIVEPLSNKRVIRDLVTEIAAPDERLGGSTRFKPA